MSLSIGMSHVTKFEFYLNHPHMKAVESKWSNQRQGDSISYKKFLPGKIITYIGILPRPNTMTCQLQSSSGSLPGTHHNMSATVQNKCQVSYLVMLGTHPIAGIHETVR